MFSRLDKIVHCRLSEALLALLCLSVAAAGFLVAGGASLDDRRLWVPPEKLNFGEVWSQERFEWTLPVTNRSNREITIEALAPSCRCAVVDVQPKPLTIAPGETVALDAVIDFTLLERFKTLERIRPVAINFIIRLENEQPASITLRGNVRHAIRVDPPVLDFGRTLIERTPFPSLTVTVSDVVPLADVRACVSPDRGSVIISREIDGVRQLIFQPSAQKVGPLTGVIRLTPVTTDGEQLPVVSIPIEGTVLTELRVLPEAVDFGPCALGKQQIATVLLESALRREFQVVDIAAPEPITIRRKPLLAATDANNATATSHGFDCLFTPSVVGQHSHEIVLTLRKADGEVVTLRVTVRAYAVGGDACGAVLSTPM